MNTIRAQRYKKKNKRKKNKRKNDKMAERRFISMKKHSKVDK